MSHLAHQPQVTKAFPLTVTATDDDLGIVEAIVSVFGIIDDGDDIIHPGAFVKTLAERMHRIRVLNSHNSRDALSVIGKPLEIRELTRAELPADILARYPEATGGLYTKTQYLLNTSEGRGVFERIKAGALNEYSIGYDPIDIDRSNVALASGKTKVVRNIRTIRLWEYSPVVFGMNPSTTTLAVKDASLDDATDKEMTPDGPQRRLGDYLIGEIQKVLHKLIDGFLSDGYLTTDEQGQLLALFDSALNTVKVGMVDDVALRPVSSMADDFWLWLGRDGTEEQKAGRVLSQRNFDRLQQASSLLVDILNEAGSGDDSTAATDEASTDGAATAKQTEPPVAGPSSAAPTSQASEAGPQPDTTPTRQAALLAHIDLELTDLERVSV